MISSRGRRLVQEELRVPLAVHQEVIHLLSLVVPHVVLVELLTSTAPFLATVLQG
jgi:hypothetical protein